MEGSRGDFSPAPGSASPMASATAKQQTAPVLVTTEPRVLGLRPSSFSSTHMWFSNTRHGLTASARSRRCVNLYLSLFL